MQVPELKSLNHREIPFMDDAHSTVSDGADKTCSNLQYSGLFLTFARLENEA